MKLALAAASAILFSQSAIAQDAMPEDRGLSTLSGGTYVMDKTHGYIYMTYSHLGFSNPTIRFDEVDAVVTLNADDVTASTLSVDIDPALIDTGIEKFDTHMRGSDLFDVENHPEITFRSTGLSLDTAYSGTMTGDLTIKGVTKSVTLDVTLNRAAPHPFKGTEAFGISASGEVMRSDFGISYGVPAVGDKVSLQIEAEFAKE